MKVNNAELITSAVKADQFPESDLPQFVIAGRSNVGKSSFINAVFNRKKLAYISSKPGKTQLINFFDIDGKFIIVDTPGYGYAKVSKKQIEKFGEMFEAYITNTKTLKSAVLLVDMRHTPTEDDISMYEYFKYFNIPVLIVGTKMDKLRKNDIAKNTAKIKTVLKIATEDVFVPYSSINKNNMELIDKYLYKYI